MLSFNNSAELEPCENSLSWSRLLDSNEDSEGQELGKVLDRIP